ncbi:MAG: TIGR02453 family protein [Alphaproteobacteria bacterium]|nr:TIGR02453 family protein [Alphaproteobacteria bacterium]
MALAETKSFTGFPKEFFAFFRELAANNEKAWFEANKPRYKEVVVAPCLSFIEAMGPRLAKISKHIVADARPNGGSMFRIYRDTRFAKDKRPYKENAGIHFRHALGRDAHAPGFYLHLEPGEVFFGGGLWMPEPKDLAAIRGAIAKKHKDWAKLTGAKAFTDRFGGVGGEALVRPPKGFDPDHPAIEDIKRKSFFAMREGKEALATSPKFLDEVTTTFADAKPFMKFLCDAVGAPF